MKEILEINEFFVEGNDQKKSHVLLHITEPGTPEELSKGYFFALAEINDGNLEQIEHLQQMIDDLESGYYETDDEPQKNAFEITLEYINRRGHHILENKEASISCLLGVVRKNEVYFAFHGNPSATIFYQENGELNSMDILADQTEEKNNQLFSSILQGNLNEGDYLFVNTPHVNDYFTADRVKKLLNIKNNHQVATHLEKTLKDINGEYSFGGIFIHIPSFLKTAHTTNNSESTGSVASLEHMIDRERSTDEIMSPPILGAIKKNINEYKDKRKEEEQAKDLLRIQEKRRQEVLKSTKHGSIETNIRHNDRMVKQPGFDGILINLGKALVTGTIWILNFIKVILITLGRILIGLFLFITNKDKRRQEVIKSVQNNFKNQKEKINSLPLISKIIFFLVIILAIIFISSLSYFKVREVNESRNAAYTSQIQTIKDKQAAAEANLIYNNSDSALVLLSEAKEMLNNLTTNSKDQQSEKDQLQTQLEESLKKIRKLDIKTPELMIDLAINNPSVKTQKLAYINNDIIAYGQEDANIYILNPVTNKIEAKTLSTTKNFKFDSTPKESDFIVFITNDNELATYDSASKLVNKKEISFPVNDVQYGPIFVYNRRLYGIDRQSGQIYKHSSTQTGFDQGTSWLKNTEDLSNAVSMAIDGDMFVLKNDGSITKFTSGEKVDFNITGLDPVLNNPTEIWTYNDTDKIYILESTNKRVIILNKEGKLIQQFTATDWQNPTDMIVRESEKTIYILDNNKIYRFYY